MLAPYFRVSRLEAKRQQGLTAAVEPPTDQTVASAGPRRSLGFGGFLKRLGATSTASSSSFENGQASTTTSKTAADSTAEGKETNAATKDETTTETAAAAAAAVAAAATKPPAKVTAPVVGKDVGRNDLHGGVRLSGGASTLGQTGVSETHRNNDNKVDNDCVVNGPPEVATSEENVDKPRSSSSDSNRGREGGRDEGIVTGTTMQRVDSHLNHELLQTMPSYNGSSSSPSGNADAPISAAISNSGCLVAKAESTSAAAAAARNLGEYTQGKTDGDDGDCGLTQNSHLEAKGVAETENVQQTREESNNSRNHSRGESQGLLNPTVNTDQEQEMREGEKGKAGADKEHRREGVNDGSECGSLQEESAHSRWSLPDEGGLGRLQTQCAVWGQFDCSLSTESNTGQERDSAASMTPSSRVGSYDMEHDGVSQ